MLDLLASSRWDESSSSGGASKDVSGVVFGTLLGSRPVATTRGDSLNGDAIQRVSEVDDVLWISHTSWQRRPRQ